MKFNVSNSFLLGNYVFFPKLKCKSFEKWAAKFFFNDVCRAYCRIFAKEQLPQQLLFAVTKEMTN